MLVSTMAIKYFGQLVLISSISQLNGFTIRYVHFWIQIRFKSKKTLLVLPKSHLPPNHFPFEYPIGTTIHNLFKSINKSKKKIVNESEKENISHLEQVELYFYQIV